MRLHDFAIQNFASTFTIHSPSFSRGNLKKTSTFFLSSNLKQTSTLLLSFSQHLFYFYFLDNLKQTLSFFLSSLLPREIDTLLLAVFFLAQLLLYFLFYFLFFWRQLETDFNFFSFFILATSIYYNPGCFDVRVITLPPFSAATWKILQLFFFLQT
jgi:hypothetical protein